MCLYQKNREQKIPILLDTFLSFASDHTLYHILIILKQFRVLKFFTLINLNQSSVDFFVLPTFMEHHGFYDAMCNALCFQIFVHVKILKRKISVLMCL